VVYVSHSAPSAGPTALRETLERRGVLGELRASLRSEVFAAMDDADDARPPLTNENLLINELIREYLAFNQYKHTLAVFLPETGQPEEPLKRSFVAQQTHLPVHVAPRPTGAGDDLPLLYSLLHGAPTPHRPQPTAPPALPPPASPASAVGAAAEPSVPPSSTVPPLAATAYPRAGPAPVVFMT
jgi:lisH domain-containing protein FOPNL